MALRKPYPILTAEEAVDYIHNGDIVSFSGFTPAGSAKVVPEALAQRALEEHAQGRQFKVRILTGASSGHSIDEDLARAEAIEWRAPYQSDSTLRGQINRQAVEYVDMHLSHLPQAVAEGFLWRINIAVVEATEITADGRVYLTTSIGASPTYLKYADKVIIEINRRQSPRLREMADIIVMPPPPYRTPININSPLTRIGWPYAQVNPKKVIGIVESDEPDTLSTFTPPGENSLNIAGHVTRFLLEEMAIGRIPKTFLPLQSGVGNIANGIMSALGSHPEVPPFYMYSEVFQNSLVDIMVAGKLLGASATSLTITPDKLQQIVDNIDFFASRIVLRPQEISNHPGIIRRLGVISINTALEFDIYGNVNSSHLFGTDIMNGIGGSGDFSRNSYLSIFTAPSVVKGGRLSTVVPMCTHIDSNEHSVQVLVTEQGLADLRGLGPSQRAKLIIKNCAHPAYRPYLEEYVRDARPGHIPHNLGRCFELHRNFLESGTMLSEP
ncbi:MAG: succinate CoA transferase [Desulfobacterales bacterium]|nr:succinate CoA transferase [Desulfobacterales bacterium]